jgi:hypothetical protein
MPESTLECPIKLDSQQTHYAYRFGIKYPKGGRRMSVGARRT